MCKGDFIIMKDLLFPWESHVMIKTPWAMPLFMLILSLILSIVTWVRKDNSKNK